MADGGETLLRAIREGRIQPALEHAPWLRFSTLARKRPRFRRSRYPTGMEEGRHNEGRGKTFSALMLNLCRWQLHHEREDVAGTWGNRKSLVGLRLAPTLFRLRHLFLEGTLTWLRREPGSRLVDLALSTWTLWEAETDRAILLISDWLPDGIDPRAFVAEVATQCAEACRVLDLKLQQHSEATTKVTPAQDNSGSWSSLTESQRLVVTHLLGKRRGDGTHRTKLIEAANLSPGKAAGRMLDRLAELGILFRLGPRKGMRLVRVPPDTPPEVKRDRSWSTPPINNALSKSTSPRGSSR